MDISDSIDAKFALCETFDPFYLLKNFAGKEENYADKKETQKFCFDHELLKLIEIGEFLKL
jgi:hypothetical protein